jgi:hypothetical protein
MTKFRSLAHQLEEWSKELKGEVQASNLSEGEESERNMRLSGLSGNRFFQATLIDLAIARGEGAIAKQLCREAKEFDPIRRKYWEWRLARIGD